MEKLMVHGGEVLAIENDNYPKKLGCDSIAEAREVNGTRYVKVFRGNNWVQIYPVVVKRRTVFFILNTQGEIYYKNEGQKDKKILTSFPLKATRLSMTDEGKLIIHTIDRKSYRLWYVNGEYHCIQN